MPCAAPDPNARAGAGHQALALTPVSHVTGHGPRFEATGRAPWLELNFVAGVPAGRWISLTYASGLFDPLVRPVIRFIASTSTVDTPLPAALFGRGQWTGRVPDQTDRILISPTNRRGPFGFSIDSWRLRTRASVLYEATRGNPVPTAYAVGSRLLGWHEEARARLANAIGGLTLGQYHEWRSARLRSPDLDGIDKPTHDWTKGVHVRFVCYGWHLDRSAFEATLESLKAQIYPNWSLLLVDAPPSGRGAADATAPSLAEPGRLLRCAPDAPVDRFLDLVDGRAVIVAPITAGDVVPIGAAAALVEHAAACPQHDLFYADEDSVDAQGRFCDSRMKPDWSPIFNAETGYINRAIYVHHRRLRNLSNWTAAELGSANRLCRQFDGAGASEVIHIRRIGRTIPRPDLSVRETEFETGQCAVPTVKAPSPVTGMPWVSVIIPTRDQPDLLTACLEGIERSTDGRDIEVLIVDNGSRRRATVALLGQLKAKPGVRVVEAPGPFNFAALCNQAATVARAALLAFLNDDINILDHDWLAKLSPWTMRPDVGAVGPAMLYPSGRLQFAGTVIGAGGFAAHVNRGTDAKVPGYLRRLMVPHEVSAVTAACLLVEKWKFDAVCGFDATCFPVDLNDVDLCLRLKARGWQSLLVPTVKLEHLESATRKRTWRPRRRYALEHQAFRERWGAAIRDDPYFHPGLSLSSSRLALG